MWLSFTLFLNYVSKFHKKLLTSNLRFRFEDHQKIYSGSFVKTILVTKIKSSNAQIFMADTDYTVPSELALGTKGFLLPRITEVFLVFQTQNFYYLFILIFF